METILSSEFKRQMVLMLDGGPHVIEDLHTSGTAQTRHKLHTRLRHLTTGRLIDRVFAESERVPVAPLETRRVIYSYAKADGKVFSDVETFDELEFSNEQLGECGWFLKENEEYKALRLDGRLLTLILPPQISLKVVDTSPPARGGLNSSWKEAKLETGLQIMVPLFIENGDVVRIDTAGKKYLGRENAGERADRFTAPRRWTRSAGRRSRSRMVRRSPPPPPESSSDSWKYRTAPFKSPDANPLDDG